MDADAEHGCHEEARPSSGVLGAARRAWASAPNALRRGAASGAALCPRARIAPRRRRRWHGRMSGGDRRPVADLDLRWLVAGEQGAHVGDAADLTGRPGVKSDRSSWIRIPCVINVPGPRPGSGTGHLRQGPQDGLRRDTQRDRQSQLGAEGPSPHFSRALDDPKGKCALCPAPTCRRPVRDEASRRPQSDDAADGWWTAASASGLWRPDVPIRNGDHILVCRLNTLA